MFSISSDCIFPFFDFFHKLEDVSIPCKYASVALSISDSPKPTADLILSTMLFFFSLFLFFFLSSLSLYPGKLIALPMEPSAITGSVLTMPNPDLTLLYIISASLLLPGIACLN